MSGRAPAPAAPAARPRLDDLRALIADLEGEGRYDCCVKVACSHCAMMAGGCRCGEGLRAGEPVCEQCALLWWRGQGDEEGVDPASVRSFLQAEQINAGAGPICRPGAGAAPR